MLDYQLLNTKLEALKAKLIPPIEGFDAFWSQQVPQFPAKGAAGVGYFKGEMGGGLYVDCLLFRDTQGKLVGVLYHYPQDIPPHEAAGNINVLVDPERQGEGIGKALLKAALKRWDIDLDQQKWTPGGDALRKSVVPAPKKPARIKLKGFRKEETTMNPAVNEKLEAMRSHLEARKSMTFGVLPSKAEFMKGWEASMEGEDEYPYHLKGNDALTAHGAGVKTSGKVDADALYVILQKLVKAHDDGDDEAGSLASGFLSTLGFEWI